jgi:hypothetical protein
MTNNDDEIEAAKIINEWLFHFDCNTFKWNAFPKNECRKYLNGKCKNVISDDSYDVTVLIDKILESKEDV